VTPATASCLYTGTIRHRRRTPGHEFTHPLALAYLDLDELPRLLDGRLVRATPGLLRFRARDHLGDHDGTASGLAAAIRTRMAALTGERPAGPIRLLAQPRSLGMCFNPASFAFCLDAAGEQLEQVLVEVTNTPWGERHVYAMSERAGGSPVVRGRFTKALHVSPFFGMDHVYHARASRPAETLSIHIENERAGEIVFDATLNLRRRELTPRSAAWLSARHPAASARVLALIYGHALGLRLRGARYHPHPAGAVR
jgi:uncharacterized protein